MLDTRSSPTPTTRALALARVRTRDRSNRLSVVDGLTVAVAILIVAAAVIGPFFVPYSPIAVVASPDRPPSSEHLFGTDQAGMDVFSRVVAGASNDLLIGLGAAITATVVGIVLGIALGMNESKRGPLGAIFRGMARALDLFQALPQIIVGLVLLAMFGASVTTMMFAIALLALPDQARVVRTETLRVRSEAYLDAARVSGESEATLVLRHVLPNASWPALENASWIFGTSIATAAALGFLGVGLAPPTPEWGAMIASGASGAISGRWWSALFPVLALAVTVITASRLGSLYLQKRL